MSYWFFFSYARPDREDGHLRRFFEDLRETIRRKTGLPLEEAAFFDSKSLQTGDEWEPGPKSEIPAIME